jgi:prevent-host-death family protein
MAVKVVSISEAENNFDAILDLAQKTPVKIERDGHPVAVIVPYGQFEYIEDAWWAIQAQEASEEGFLSQKESEDFLAEVLNTKE